MDKTKTIKHIKSIYERKLYSCIQNNYLMKLNFRLINSKKEESSEISFGENEHNREVFLRNEKDLLIVNSSGMGKTTFIYYLGQLFLSYDIENIKYYPIVLTCQQLNESTKNKSIREFIEEQIESLYKNSSTQLIDNSWQNLCLLLDGFDQSKDTSSIISSINNKEINYKEAKIIISSRENTSHLIPKSFILIKLTLPKEKEIEKYFGQKAFLKLKPFIDRSTELIKTPVLLEMIKTVFIHSNISDIKNRVCIYNSFYKVLIQKELEKPRYWTNRIDIKYFLENDLAPIIERLAFESLVNNNILEVDNKLFKELIKDNELKEAFIQVGIVLEYFECINKTIIFRHQSFQSYFAARYIHSKKIDFVPIIKKIADLFYNDAWLEVIEFYILIEDTNNKQFLSFIDNLVDNEKHNYLLCFLSSLIYITPLLFETSLGKQEFLEEILEKRLQPLIDEKYVYLLSKNLGRFKPLTQEQADIFIELILLPMLDLKHSTIVGYALSKLAEIGTSKHVQALMSLLSNPDYEIRRDVALVIGQIGRNEDINILKQLLNDEERDVREKVVCSIYNLASYKELPLVKQLVEDYNDELFYESALVDFINRITTSDSLLKMLYKDNSPLRRYAVKAFIQKEYSREYKMSVIKDLLYISNVSFKKEILDSLFEIIQPDDFCWIQNLLTLNDIAITFISIELLGKIGTKEAKEFLISLLKDDDFCIRRAVLEELSVVGSGEDMNKIVPFLNDEDSLIRFESLNAITKISKRSNRKEIVVVKNLLEFESNLNNITIAVRYIQKYGSQDDIIFIKQYLHNKGLEIKDAVNKAIKSRQIDTLKQLVDEPLIDSLFNKHLFDALKPEKNLDIINDFLGEESLFVSMFGGSLIRQIKNVGFLKELILNDEQSLLIRKEAIFALGIQGKREDIEFLQELINNSIYYDISNCSIDSIERLLRKLSKSINLKKEFFQSCSILNDSIQLQKDLIVYVNNKTITYLGIDIKLTPFEFEFVHRLVLEPDRKIPYEELMTGNFLKDDGYSTPAHTHRTNINNKFKSACTNLSTGFSITEPNPFKGYMLNSNLRHSIEIVKN